MVILKIFILSLATCLTNVIGLSNSSCPCWEEETLGNFAELNESHSDRYVNNPKFTPAQLPFSNKPTDCQTGGIWDVLQQARLEGINDFIDRYCIELERRQKKSFDNFTGTIGMTRDASPCRVQYDWAGFCINPNIHKGASICLNGGCSWIETSEPIELCVVNMNDPSTVLATATITNGKDSPLEFTGTTTLPLSKNGKKQRYCLLYNAENISSAYSFEPHCGCGSVPKPGWMAKGLFSVSGIQTNDKENLNQNYTLNNQLHGLLVDFTIKCDGVEWMCNVDEDFWCNTKFGRAASTAMVLYANVCLTQLLMKPGGVNFNSLVKPESMYKHMGYLNKQLDSIMPFLVERIPEDISDCYYCDPAYGWNLDENIV